MLCAHAWVHIKKWSYQTLGKAVEFGSFVDRLESEIARRGLTGSEDEILAQRGPARGRA